MQGNFIGTNAAGTEALPNRFDGVFLDGGASHNSIGGTAAGAGNVIAGNRTAGVQVLGQGASGNVIAGNRIGTAADGSSRLGNGTDGVFLHRASGNTIAGNTIVANRTGIQIFGPDASDNDVQGNVIMGNEFGVFLNAAPGTRVRPGENTIGGNRTADLFDTFALPAVIQNARLIEDGSTVTAIVLTFSTRMDRGRAEALRNYRIRRVGRGPRIGVRDAAYDDLARTVTLMLSQPIGRDVALRLMVNATSRRGLIDATKRLLDGNRDGRPGGNAVIPLGPATSTPTVAGTTGRVGDPRPGGVPEPSRRSRTAALAGDRISTRAVDRLLRSGEFPAVSRLSTLRIAPPHH